MLRSLKTKVDLGFTGTHVASFSAGDSRNTYTESLFQ